MQAYPRYGCGDISYPSSIDSGRLAHRPMQFRARAVDTLFEMPVGFNIRLDTTE
jgi:hypothetical protein